MSMAGRHCYIWVMTTSIVIAVSLLVQLCQVNASATLELLMVRYDNPSARDSDGHHCDYWFITDCDHIFRFALDRGDSNDNPRSHHYWFNTTGHFRNKNIIVFGGDMAGVSNPIISYFSTWPSVGVKFKVLVTDYDSSSGNDDVDGFIQLLNSTPSRNISVADWTTIVMRGIRSRHTTSLTIKYKLYCHANYYSSNCSVYCVASNTDTGGHYTCDPATGNIVCRPGWEDESTKCKTSSDDCLNHRCLNGATCVDGVRTYTCLCPPGYTGASCETDVNECASNPCQHGGTCDDQVNGFTCLCPPGFPGKLCSGVELTNDIVGSTLKPHGNIINVAESSDDTESSPGVWLYVLICAICIILLGLMVLIGFIYSRRRKTRSRSESIAPIMFPSTPSPSWSQPPSPAPEAGAAAPAASFCVVSDNVDLRVTNSWNHRLEKLTALNSRCDRDDTNCGNVYDSSKARAKKAEAENVYDTVDDVIRASSVSSPSPASLPESEKAAAAASGYYSLDDESCFRQLDPKTKPPAYTKY